MDGSSKSSEFRANAEGLSWIRSQLHWEATMADLRTPGVQGPGDEAARTPATVTALTEHRAA